MHSITIIQECILNHIMLKKISSIALIASLSLGSVFMSTDSVKTQSAEHHHGDNCSQRVGYAMDKNIQPRLPLCTNCGNGYVTTKTEYGKKVPDGQTSHCLHGKPYGTDKKFKQTVTKSYKCSNCENLGSNSSIQYTYQCKGFY